MQDTNIATTEQTEPVLQRSVGVAKVGFKRRGSLTVLKDLYQQGSGKIRLPQLEPSETCEAVLINTSGGLTDHDRFTVEASWDAETQAVVTTQAAERIYKARKSAAHIETSLDLKENALGFWLPQETILFDRGRFKRTCSVTMEKGAELLACESMVFGREAMGERVQTGFLAENWSVRYDGRLVFADHSKLDGDIPGMLAEPSIANDALAWGTVLFVSERAKEHVGMVREIAAQQGVTMACSARGPVLVIRVLGKSGPVMREMLTVVLETLYSSLTNTDGGEATQSYTVTHGQAHCLPRVWYC